VSFVGRPERPIDLDDGPVAEFAAGLRRLRERAGRPSYRELAQRASFSTTVLSEAAGGRVLPTLPVTLAYVRACGADAREWERRWRKAASSRRLHGAPDAAPYRGLACYDIGDAGLFFGRDMLTQELVHRVTRGRFLAVFGPSGSGKSSLLRAGLAAAVARGDVAGMDGWKVAVLTPGPQPLAALATAVAALAGRDMSAPGTAELAGGPGWLASAVQQVAADEPAGAAVVLVVDQFEELFTVCSNSKQREIFVDALLAAAAAEGGRVRVVLGVRADFYAHCARWPGLVDALRDAQLLIGPMSTDDLHDVIVKPAAACGLTVDRALLTRLVGDVGGEPGVLPLLSHALLETWHRRQAGRLTLAGYQDADGVAGAISATAEDIYLSYGQDQQKMLRWLFLRLVTPGGSEAGGVRQRVQLADLAVGDDPEQVAELVDRLARSRLLTADGHGVQIAHEALISCWPRLAGWLEDGREGLRIQRRLAAAVAAWDGFGRDPAALYRGAPLAAARAWADHDGDLTGLTQQERDFLEASAAAEISQLAHTQRAAKRLRRLAAALAALLLVAAGTAGVAMWQRQTTITVQRAALSAQYVAEAGALANTNPSAAGLAALAAWKVMPTAAARSALLSNAATWCYPEFCTGSPFLHLFGKGSGNAVASRHDGIFITYSADNTVRLWDILAGGLLPASLAPHAGPTDPVAFSQHGSLLALATVPADVGPVQVWDTARHKLVAVLTGSGRGPVNDVAFSPNDRLVAVAGTRSVRLWDLATHRSVNLPAGSGYPMTVAFSPQSNALAVATCCNDRTVTIWDITGPFHPKIARQLRVSAADIYEVAYAPPHGDILAVGSGKGIELWDLRHGTRTLLHMPLPDMRAFAFNPAGTTLAVTGGVSSATIPGLGPTGQYGGATTRLNPGTVTLWSIAKRSVIATLALRPTVLGYYRGGTIDVDGYPAVSGYGAPQPDASDIVAWDLDPSRAAQRICQMLTHDPSLHAHETAVPGASYPRLCRTTPKP
jgi:Novel STAND NTPase 1/Helix-turn-helix domain/WD domain, G-beta repeat